MRIQGKGYKSVCDVTRPVPDLMVTWLIEDTLNFDKLNTEDGGCL